ncbi:endochitinase [Folsomia candida]|nr:endochitinase [Folsomia candida]
MPFYLSAKSAFFIFVQATILVGDALTKEIADNSHSMFFDKSRKGIGVDSTRDSCIKNRVPSEPRPTQDSSDEQGDYLDEASSSCTEFPVTTPSPGELVPFQCGIVEGTFPEPSDCRKYNRCIVIGGNMHKYTMTCPDASYFNKVRNLCAVGTC